MSNRSHLFQKGNPGGPGRPKRETERAYLNVMRSKVSLEDWGKVVKKALDDAKKGDSVARAWLSKYLVGDDPIAMLDVLDKLTELEARNGLA